uniref:Thioredoxin n=1 Tax=Cacopsylla melanoneura TaxID=428564 RepID=A0A8D9B3L8_9HEMI
MAAKVSNMADLKSKFADAGNKLIVIDFYATWCGPCKQIAPKIEELAAEYQDVVFLKVDVDENEDIAMEYDISSMPTFVFVKNSEKVEQFSGANFDKLKATVLAKRS